MKTRQETQGRRVQHVQVGNTLVITEEGNTVHYSWQSTLTAIETPQKKIDISTIIGRERANNSQIDDGANSRRSSQRHKNRDLNLTQVGFCHLQNLSCFQVGLLFQVKGWLKEGLTWSNLNYQAMWRKGLSQIEISRIAILIVIQYSSPSFAKTRFMGSIFQECQQCYQ